VILAVFDDLLLGSNVLGMLRAAGFEAQLTGPELDPGGAELVIVDLAATTFDGVALIERLRDRRTIGVYSHVDVETRRRAEAAGFDLIVPRSRFAREGPALVRSVLSSCHTTKDS
jgi:DNA-binding response OmpR family regulator